jgi:hypothetical protein
MTYSRFGLLLRRASPQSALNESGRPKNLSRHGLRFNWPLIVGLLLCLAVWLGVLFAYAAHGP